MMARSWMALPFLGLSFVIAGCSHGLLIGEEPSDPPPQLMFLGAKDAQGREYMTWERVSSFGRVPQALKAAGDITCMKLGMALRAQGYHPRALDANGHPMVGGAYFCQVALTADSPNPPQIVVRDGVPVWSDPGAFSAVPDKEIDRGIRECARQNAKLRPLGYHPEALDIQGQPISGGGFLCVE